MANTICWFDLPVVNLDRAVQFYAKVLAADVKKESHEGMEFAVFPHGDRDVAGCLYKDEESKPSNHGILVYFSVNGRLDAALKEVEKLGGKILKPRHQIGPYGSRAIVLDSEGNRIALHEET